MPPEAAELAPEDLTPEQRRAEIARLEAKITSQLAPEELSPEQRAAEIARLEAKAEGRPTNFFNVGTAQADGPPRTAFDALPDLLFDPTVPREEVLRRGEEAGQGFVEAVEQAAPEIGKFALEIGLEAGAAALLGPLAGRVAPLLARAAPSIARGLGEGLGIGVGSLANDKITGEEADYNEALIEGGLGGFLGTAVFKGQDLLTKRAIKRAAQAEDDIVAGLLPSKKELSPFDGKPIANTIRDALYNTNIFKEVKTLEDLSDAVVRRTGGFLKGADERISGEIGGKIQLVSKELDNLSRQQNRVVRFSDIEKQVENQLKDAAKVKQFSSDFESTFDIVRSELDGFRNRIAAANLFPDEVLPAKAIPALKTKVKELRAARKSIQQKIDQSLPGISEGVKKKPKKLSDKQRQRLNEQLEEIDFELAEIENPLVSFANQFQLQKSADRDAMRHFKRAKTQQSNEGEAFIAIANGSRAFVKDEARRVAEAAGRPDLAQDFFTLKKEFSIAKELESVATNALKRGQTELRRASSPLAVVGKTKEKISTALGGKNLSRRDQFEIGVKGANKSIAQESSRPGLTRRVARIGSSLGSRVFIVESVVPDTEALAETPNRENLSDRITLSLLNQQGIITDEQLEKGVDLQAVPSESLQEAQGVAQQALSAYRQTAERFGPDARETALALSELSKTFPKAFKKPTTGIPGEVRVGGRVLLPNEQDRLRYSERLRVDNNLSKGQRALLRSSAHRGEVIPRPKRKRARSVAPEDQPTLEADAQ